MLQLNNIKKLFGTHLIFSIDQLTIPKGIHWLKGANGAGKSTLLKIIAGELPFEGEIQMNGSLSIKKNPTAYRLLLNHAEAEPIYPSFLTGMDILAFVSDVKKGSPEQIKQVREILSIDNYLENPIGTYSSGMLKKLSLLLAFTGQPDWILLDEPLTTLDIDSQKNLCRLIMQRHGQGTSFIITSHHDIAHSDIDYNKTYLLEKQQIQELTTVS